MACDFLSHRVKKILLWGLLIVGGYSVFYSSLYFLNDRFSLSFIQEELPPSSTVQKINELETILNQEFCYLGRGSQMFVFESEDGKYILKLINFQRFRLPFFLGGLNTKKLELKKEKEAHLLKSLELAETLLKEECAIIYVHLKKTMEFEGKIRFRDKLERKYLLDINETPFILQKKGELLLSHFQKLINEGKEEEAKDNLSSLVALLLKRYEKGIEDSDSFLAKNAGFIGNAPVFIDIGQFDFQKMNPPFTGEIRRVTRKLHLWLEEHSPELAIYLDKIIAET